MFVCVTYCLQESPLSVVNPRQVQAYGRLSDRCVLLPIIHFVTFIFKLNIAASFLLSSLSNSNIWTENRSQL